VTPVVRLLLIANVGAFFLQITVPGLTNAFMFVPQLVLTRPWTLVTYMFLHAGITHILFNMLTLYFFGPRVEERIGSRRFTTLYFLSGLSGALLSFVFSYSSRIIGASAGVFGVSLAFAYFWPTALIYIWGVLPIQARMLVVITTLLSLWSGFGGMRQGIAHFAHLGGYAGAYFYLRWLDRSRTAFKRRATAAPAEASDRAARWQSIDRGKVHEANRAELDRILDKIGAHGVESLTPEERVFLSNFVPPDDRTPPPS
jgi:membrane associated rhomboid family serine protease